MQIEYIDIDKVIPYANNPRHNDGEAVDKVAASIKEYGFKQPLIVDKENVVICGHTRLKGAKKLGLEKIPVIKADDLTPAQIKAYRIADNKVSEYSSWDNELLSIEFEELQDLDFDLDLTGFEDFEIESLFEEEETAESVEDDYEVELPKEPNAKLGDVYQLGKHRLMCGDSTSIDDVGKLMNGDTADISFTSPPYNVGHNLGYDDTSKYENDDDNKSDYVDFLKQFTLNAYANSQYTFVNIQQLANNKVDLIEWLHEFKHLLCDTLIWDKGHAAPAMAHKVTNSCFEYIYVFNENAKRSIGTRDFHGNVDNIVRIPSQRKNEYSDIHNATFPIELPTHIINNFSNAEDSILDLFGGTGTTLIACEQLNRTCYTMELDPKYVDVIIDRWETLTGEKAVLLNVEAA